MFYLGKKQLNVEGHFAQSPNPLDWSSHFASLAQSSQYPALRAFYESGVVPGCTPIGEVPMVALDFETTGLDPSRDSIVSIGLVPMTLQRIRCQQAKHWLIKPQTRLHATSVVVHGITHSAVEDAPDISQVIDALLASLQGKIVVVHYSRIERSFLYAALKRQFNEGIEFPVIDTMALEARFARSAGRTLWRGLLGRAQPSIRLVDSRKRYHLPYYRQHNALTDALACAELLQAQSATHLTSKTPLSEIWS